MNRQDSHMIMAPEAMWQPGKYSTGTSWKTCATA
jgi:hypothetical protein